MFVARCREEGCDLVKKTRRLALVLGCILAAIALAGVALVASNQMNADFGQLDEADQAILSEYNTLCDSLAEDDVWEGFDLEGKTILAMPGDWAGGYLINPSEPVSSVFAKQVALPEGWGIEVYRVSALEPDLLGLFLEGNFNTLGETYSLYGSDYYFVKYDRVASVTDQWSSDHFTAFLAHEAFHYYMQDNWPDGSRFSTEGLTDEDVALLGEEYQVLARIQAELLAGAPDREVLRAAATDYLDVMDQRLAANPEYARQELEMELVEGTANYVGIQAARRVGYDLGVMYFTNQKNVSFDEVIPQYETGGIDKGYLADRLPYETGALLCELMDELGIPGWQASLNAQSPDAPVTLYDLMRESVEA